MDIIPVNTLSQPITVIGAGAIGSMTVLNLAKMGFENITVYDYDVVSVENMNAQWFRHKDIGKFKVDALDEQLQEFTKTKITKKPELYKKQKLSGIVISAVDKMSARHDIWKSVKNNKGVKFLIDPRMGAEYALSYVVDPNLKKDQDNYAQTLYSNEEAVQEPCTAKSTMYTSSMISGHVAKHVKDVVTGEPYARTTHWDIKRNNQLTWSGGGRPKRDAAVN